MSDTTIFILVTVAFILLVVGLWSLPALLDSEPSSDPQDLGAAPPSTSPISDATLKQALAKLDETFTEQQRLAKRVATLEKNVKPLTQKEVDDAHMHWLETSQQKEDGSINQQLQATVSPYEVTDNPRNGRKNINVLPSKETSQQKEDGSINQQLQATVSPYDIKAEIQKAKSRLESLQTKVDEQPWWLVPLTKETRKQKEEASKTTLHHPDWEVEKALKVSQTRKKKATKENPHLVVQPKTKAKAKTKAKTKAKANTKTKAKTSKKKAKTKTKRNKL